MSRLPILLLVPLAFATPSASQDKQPKPEPAHTIPYAVPPVARPGQKQTIVLRGRKLDTTTDIKLDAPDEVKAKFVTARKATVPNNYPAERVGDSEVEIELELPKDI